MNRAAAGLAQVPSARVVLWMGVPRLIDDVAKVRCPYCRERVALFVDPDTTGTYVEDCSVCCRPWSVFVAEDEDGQRNVEITAAQ